MFQLFSTLGPVLQLLSSGYLPLSNNTNSSLTGLKYNSSLQVVSVIFVTLSSPSKPSAQRLFQVRRLAILARRPTYYLQVYYPLYLLIKQENVLRLQTKFMRIVLLQYSILAIPVQGYYVLFYALTVMRVRYIFILIYIGYIIYLGY